MSVLITIFAIVLIPFIIVIAFDDDARESVVGEVARCFIRGLDNKTYAAVIRTMKGTTLRGEADKLKWSALMEGLDPVEMTFDRVCGTLNNQPLNRTQLAFFDKVLYRISMGVTFTELIEDELSSL